MVFKRVLKGIGRLMLTTAVMCGVGLFLCSSEVKAAPSVTLSKVEDEGELTEEELLNRIIEYKKYKEICKELREQYLINSKRFYKLPDKVELPKRKIEEQFEVITLADIYKQILEKRDKKIE